MGAVPGSNLKELPTSFFKSHKSNRKSDAKPTKRIPDVLQTFNIAESIHRWLVLLLLIVFPPFAHLIDIYDCQRLQSVIKLNCSFADPKENGICWKRLSFFLHCR